MDEQGEILAANSTSLDYFGVQSLHDLGSSLLDLSRRFDIRPDSPDGSLTLPSILRSEQTPSQYWRALSTGAHKPKDLLVHAREIRSSPLSSRRYLILLQDITEIRSLERARDQFVQVMGHEIRNPLQVMKAVVQLMDTEPGAFPSLKRYVKILGGQLGCVSALVEDLFTACRVGGRKIALNLRETDLADLVAEWVDSSAPPTEHPLICLFSRDVKVPVCVDEVRIREILSNVLGNAAKYSPAGKRIWVDVHILADHALVVVEDEGIGIPKDEMDSVFQAFYRATNSAICGMEGAGLGLYISRELARLHGGDLWAEERQGAGTTLKLRLPLSIKTL